MRAVGVGESYAGLARQVVERHGRGVLAEAVEQGAKVPDHLEAYVPRATAERAEPELRALFERCFRAGVERRRSER